MYEGKEICQGCKKSGEQVPRYTKNELCVPCQSTLEAGKAINFENTTEYTQVRDWVNGFYSIDFQDRSLDTLANALFKSLNNEYAKFSNRVETQRSQHQGAVFYNIPTNVVAPLTDFLKAMHFKLKDIREIKEKAEEQARNAVSVERDRIYNAGIAAGKNLLIQLNAGEITLGELDKNRSYSNEDIHQ